MKNVKTTFQYPDSYKVLSLEAQIQRILDLFPDSGIGDIPETMQLVEKLKSIPVSDGMEGYFAVLNPQKFYHLIANKVFGALERQYGKIKYQKGEHSSSHLRQTERSSFFWSEIVKQQNNRDILIIEAQLGLKYLNYSVDEVLSGKNSLTPLPDTDFGLTAFHAGIITLAHPSRFAKDIVNLTDENKPLIYCPGMSCFGDEYNSQDNDFASVPYFWLGAECMTFGFVKKSENCRYWAPATGRKISI